MPRDAPRSSVDIAALFDFRRETSSWLVVVTVTKKKPLPKGKGFLFAHGSLSEPYLEGVNRPAVYECRAGEGESDQ